MASERLFIYCPACGKSVYLGKTMNYYDWYCSGRAETTLNAVYAFIGEHYVECNRFRARGDMEPFSLAFQVVDELTVCREASLGYSPKRLLTGLRLLIARFRHSMRAFRVAWHQTKKGNHYGLALYGGLHGVATTWKPFTIDPAMDPKK